MSLFEFRIKCHKTLLFFKQSSIVTGCYISDYSDFKNLKINEKRATDNIESVS